MTMCAEGRRKTGRTSHRSAADLNAYLRRLLTLLERRALEQADEGGVMPYVERPPSKRTRLVWLIVSWVLFFGPFTVFFFFWFGWWGLISLALALWFSYDYLKRGGFTEQVDEFVTFEGRNIGRYVERRRNERDDTGR